MNTEESRTLKIIRSQPQHADEYDVEVALFTYNHESYVLQALASILRQNFQGKLRISVHDDNSKDGTVELSTKFLAANSTVDWEIVVQKTNQFSQHRLNFVLSHMRSRRSKYVACLDGDDFWISTNKLQKQFDIMTANPDISLSHHEIVLPSRLSKVYFTQPNLLFRSTRPNTLLLGECPIGASSAMVLRSALPSTLNELAVANGGSGCVIWLSSLLRGNLVFVPGLKAFYRLSGSQLYGSKSRAFKREQWRRISTEILPGGVPVWQKVISVVSAVLWRLAGWRIGSYGLQTSPEAR